MPLTFLEEAGYFPVVIFGTRVSPVESDQGAVPDTTNEIPAVPTLLEQIRVLLDFERAVNRGAGFPPGVEPGKEPEAGCSIRDLFHGHVKRVLDQQERSRSPVSCLLLRLDGVEQLSVGDEPARRQVRDRLARIFLDVLREGVRISDFVCRYDSTTFALLLDDTGMDGARQCICRLRESMNKRRSVRAGSSELTIAGQWELCCFLRNDRESELAVDPPAEWTESIRPEHSFNVLDTDTGR